MAVAPPPNLPPPNLPPRKQPLKPLKPKQPHRHRHLFLKPPRSPQSPQSPQSQQTLPHRSLSLLPLRLLHLPLPQLRLQRQHQLLWLPLLPLSPLLHPPLPRLRPLRLPRQHQLLWPPPLRPPHLPHLPQQLLPHRRRALKACLSLFPQARVPCPM